METILTSRRERIRFLRFAVVGSIGAVIDFGSFNFMVSLLHVNAVLASVISFSAAVTSNFIWHHFWTYRDSRTKPIVQKLGQFVLVSISGLAIRTPIFAWLESRLIPLFAAAPLPSPLTPAFVGHNLALVAAVLIVMLWNFFVNRYWTYNDVNAAAAP